MTVQKIEKTKRPFMYHEFSIYKLPKDTIQKIAEKLDTPNGQIKILFQPIGHSELNPIHYRHSMKEEFSRRVRRYTKQ